MNVDVTNFNPQYCRLQMARVDVENDIVVETDIVI